MTVPLYMDQHVPSAITQGLRRRGVDVVTTQEDGTATWGDEKILERATSLGRTLFTEDEDFLAIVSTWQQTGRTFSGLVFAQQLDITIGRAIADLELIAKALDPVDMLNRVEFIPF